MNMGEKTATAAKEGPYAIPFEVHLYDCKGRFIRGRIVADHYVKVDDSNVVFRGAILEKQPYLSWETAMEDRRGTTFLTPTALLHMSRMFEEGWDDDEETEDDSEEDRPRFVA